MGCWRGLTRVLHRSIAEGRTGSEEGVGFPRESVSGA